MGFFGNHLVKLSLETFWVVYLDNRNSFLAMIILLLALSETTVKTENECSGGKREIIRYLELSRFIYAVIELLIPRAAVQELVESIVKDILHPTLNSEKQDLFFLLSCHTERKNIKDTSERDIDKLPLSPVREGLITTGIVRSLWKKTPAWEYIRKRME